jgi:hypothetical protein
MSSPLVSLWNASLSQRKESTLRFLPDEALLLFVYQKPTSEDVAFLAEQVKESVAPAVSAVRLLALFAENQHVSIEQVRPLLAKFLFHHHPGVRIAVVESFWLLADRESRPMLEAALKSETHQEVRDNLLHVIRLLE